MGTINQVNKIAKKMRVLGRKILEVFKRKHCDACSQVDAWEAEANAANWRMPLDIKQRYSAVSILPNDYVVFNIKGNRYRLKVKVNYENKIVLITNAGTHDEYMKW